LNKPLLQADYQYFTKYLFQQQYTINWYSTYYKTNLCKFYWNSFNPSTDIYEKR